MGVKLIIILLLGILLVNEVYASEVKIISVTKQDSENPYRDDSVKFKGIVQADQNNFCNLIDCSYNVGSDSGCVRDDGGCPATELPPGQIQEFPFSINAEGLSPISVTLTVSCKTKTFCAGGSPSSTYSVPLTFQFPGDGTCSASKEKCENYG